MSDSIEGPAFGKTPPFNVSLLADVPVQPEAQWGDWRDTTYTTAAAPQFNAAYIVVRLGRGIHAHDAQLVAMFPSVRHSRRPDWQQNRTCTLKQAGCIIVLPPSCYQGLLNRGNYHIFYVS